MEYLRMMDFANNSNGYTMNVLILVVACSLLFAVAPRKRQVTMVPIILRDEISSASKRMTEYSLRGRQLLEKGYAKYKDQIWGYDTRDGIKLVIPRNRWDEFKSHPGFTFKASVDNDMLVEFTKFGGPPDYFNKAITAGLNPTLGEFVPVLHALVIEHMKSVVGEFKDWEEIHVHQRVLKLVTRVSARAFFGSSVTSSDEWLGIAYGYLGAVIATIRFLKMFPPWLRPIVHFFSPQKKAIDKQFRAASKLVAETIRRRREAGGIQLDSPPSLFDHLTTGKNNQYADDLQAQTLHQMTLIAVGNSTTVSSMIQAIYDLIDSVKYVPDLLAEIQQAERDSNGLLTRKALQNMRLMDSLLKESFRLNGSGITTFARASVQDVTLKDGILIPKGTKVEIASGAIDRDPAKWPEPLKFDATRHMKAREQIGHENQHTFVSTSADDLGFGYGRHVCPGRYLTDIIDKLVMCELLLNYELKFPDGNNRPINLEYENIAEADPSAAIMIKSKIR